MTVTICESFQIMLPGGGTVIAFCGRILILGRWNLQMSWCKCLGIPLGQPPRMAADNYIRRPVYWQKMPFHRKKNYICNFLYNSFVCIIMLVFDKAGSITYQYIAHILTLHVHYGFHKCVPYQHAQRIIGFHQLSLFWLSCYITGAGILIQKEIVIGQKGFVNIPFEFSTKSWNILLNLSHSLLQG